MAYTAVGPFVDGSEPAISAANLNTMETGIVDAHGLLAARAVVQIAEVNLAVDTSEIAFTGIPQSYKHLMVLGRMRGTIAGTSGYDFLTFTCNGDSSAVYDRQLLRAVGTTVDAVTQLAQTLGSVCALPPGGAAAGVYGAMQFTMLNYTSTTRFKPILASGSALLNTATTPRFEHDALWYNSLDAVTSLSFRITARNLAAGSSLSLYGLL